MPALHFVEADPGETVTLSMLVQNQTRLDADIDATIHDMVAGDGTDSTAFEYVEVGAARRGAGAWLSTTATTTTRHVAAGTQQTITMRLAVPTDAGAGGHYAALELRATDPRESDGQVRIDYATHIPILITVSGEFARDLHVGVTPEDRWRWSGGDTSWRVRLHNRGDVHEIVSGRLRINGLINGRSSAPLRGGVLLPGEQRDQVIAFDLRSAPDRYDARVVVQLEDADPVRGATTAQVIVLPWWLLLLVASAITAIIWRMRTRERWARRAARSDDSYADPDQEPGG